jgi:UDP-2,4-diacetamido-2,4,6-trideoxy-beta-L-altropyranose hydrolase
VNQSSPPRILFLADAGAEVGGGHVMRCLTLARALVDRGAECAFVESRASAPILRRFGWPAHTLLAMSDADNLPALVDYATSLADLFAADAVVLDHYQTAIADEDYLRSAGRKIIVIDDLAERRHDATLLVDPSFGRRPEAYRGLVAEGTTLLTGPAHALVRPEFASARHRALSRRARHGPVRRAMVSLGLTDLGAVTHRVVRALIDILDDGRLDIVLGHDAPSIPALTEMARDDRRLHLWVDTAEMASLMADADIAIGAGGSSVWERATVGLPSVTVILAENQRAMVGQMAEASLTLAVDATDPAFETELREGWSALASDQGLRWRLTESSAELCDGRGAERVAEAMIGLLR